MNKNRSAFFLIAAAIAGISIWLLKSEKGQSFLKEVKNKLNQWLKTIN